MYKITPAFFKVFKSDIDKEGDLIENVANFIVTLKKESPDVFQWMIRRVFKKDLESSKDFSLLALFVGFYLGAKMVNNLMESEIMDLEDMYADCDQKNKLTKKYTEYLEGILSELADD